MVTTEALKLLYKKLGGSADVEHITAISDMVDLIEDVAGGGGGGASGLVVNITADDTTLTLDKTYTEITNSINNGTMPVFIQDYEGGLKEVSTKVAVYGVMEGTYLIGTITFNVDAGQWVNTTYMSDSADGVLSTEDPH